MKKMDKKGFVLLESILVLVVVALSLSVLMSSFSLISRKTREKEYYDRSSDKYLLYSIMNLGTDEKCNYWTNPSVCNGVTFNEINFQASPGECIEYNDTHAPIKVGVILPHCNELFTEFGITHLYAVDDVRRALKSSDVFSKYDNGTIEYMKTLKKCRDCNYSTNSTTCNDPIPYMIGVFNRGGNLYYSSIVLDNKDLDTCAKTSG